MFFEEIPSFILHHLLTFLTKNEIIKISEVNKRFSNILKSSERYKKIISCGTCKDSFEAIIKQHDACCKSLYKKSTCKGIKYLIYKFGTFRIFKWFYNNHFKIDFKCGSKIVIFACGYGRLKFVEYLMENKPKFYYSSECCQKTIKYNNLNCLEFFVNGRYTPEQNLMECAFFYKNIYAIKCLLEKNLIIKHKYIEQIFYDEYFEIFKICLDYCEIDEDDMRLLIENGSINCIKYLHQRGGIFNVNNLITASTMKKDELKNFFISLGIAIRKKETKWIVNKFEI